MAKPGELKIKPRQDQSVDNLHSIGKENTLRLDKTRTFYAGVMSVIHTAD